MTDERGWLEMTSRFTTEARAVELLLGVVVKISGMAACASSS